MPESERQRLPRWGDRKFAILTSAIMAVVGVAVIVVVVWPSGKSTGSSTAIGTGTGSSNRPGATASAVAAAQPPTQAAAEEANVGNAVKPTNSLRVAAWKAGHGGTAWRAVSAQLGTVLMMHAAKQVPQLPQACQVLGTAVTTARTAPPIPDRTMELWYERGLAQIGAGAADCRASITSKLTGDEDLVVHQNAALINRAMSELSTGSKELYKATAYVKTTGRP
jgi:hypothetical protein